MANIVRCGKCNHIIKKGVSVCPYCGAQFGAPAAPEPPAQQPYAPQQPQQPYAPQQPQQPYAPQQPQQPYTPQQPQQPYAPQPAQQAPQAPQPAPQQPAPQPPSQAAPHYEATPSSGGAKKIIISVCVAALCVAGGLLIRYLTSDHSQDEYDISTDDAAQYNPEDSAVAEMPELRRVDFHSGTYYGEFRYLDKGWAIGLQLQVNNGNIVSAKYLNVDHPEYSFPLDVNDDGWSKIEFTNAKQKNFSITLSPYTQDDCLYGIARQDGQKSQPVIIFLSGREVSPSAESFEAFLAHFQTDAQFRQERSRDLKLCNYQISDGRLEEISSPRSLSYQQQFGDWNNERWIETFIPAREMSNHYSVETQWNYKGSNLASFSRVEETIGTAMNPSEERYEDLYLFKKVDGQWQFSYYWHASTY